MYRVFASFLALTVYCTEPKASSDNHDGCSRASSDKYRYFSVNERVKLREKAKEMFYFGYDNYMNFAFPKDELDPIHCTGRGPDYDDP